MNPIFSNFVIEQEIEHFTDEEKKLVRETAKSSYTQARHLAFEIQRRKREHQTSQKECPP